MAPQIARASVCAYHPLMLPRSIRSRTAAWLALLLGVLHTGLPSHGHEVEGQGVTVAQVLRSDHHSHGVTLVELAERVQSAPVHLPALAAAAEGSAYRAQFRNLAVFRTKQFRPIGRAPPPANASRAPPQLV